MEDEIVTTSKWVKVASKNIGSICSKNFKLQFSFIENSLHDEVIERGCPTITIREFYPNGYPSKNGLCWSYDAFKQLLIGSDDFQNDFEDKNLVFKKQAKFYVIEKILDQYKKILRIPAEFLNKFHGINVVKKLVTKKFDEELLDQQLTELEFNDEDKTKLKPLFRFLDENDTNECTADVKGCQNDIVDILSFLALIYIK